MPFTLALHFEFLCAFAPPIPFSQSPKETWVVLRDLRGEQPNQRHHARLLYDVRDRVPNSDVQAAGLRPVGRGPRCGGTPRRYLELVKQHLEVRPEGDQIGADDLESSSRMDKLLAIEKADIGMEIFDSRLLEEDDPRISIAARLQLRTGRLDATKLTSRFGLVNTTTSETVWSQSLARRVVCTIPIQDFVDLQFTTFGAPSSETLRLRSRSHDGVVEVTLRNCEIEQTCSGMPPYGQSDAEINHYLPMSRDYDPTRPPPRLRLSLQDNIDGVCAPKTFSSRSRKADRP
ncbi:MAG: hypothetical protein AAGA65_23810 [Actinomycetota bacterium]